MLDDLINKNIGNCHIKKLLGRGGMGSVYLGHHLGLDIPVAVKILNPNWITSEELVQRFFLEARAAAKIDSPYVVRVLQVAQENGLYFIQMEFVAGQSLAQILKEQSPLEIRWGVSYLYQIAMGLQTAHEAGIVHRDIKPENILITPKGQVKITDFGLAKSFQKASHLTQAGQILGTPQYMSPEQCSGQESDTRSDIYSLGVTLYYMLTGQLPFTSENTMSLLIKHLQGKFEPPRTIRPEIPLALEKITLQMMARQPVDRYASLQQVLSDLSPVLPTYGMTPAWNLGTPMPPTHSHAPTMLTSNSAIAEKTAAHLPSASNQTVANQSDTGTTIAESPLSNDSQLPIISEDLLIRSSPNNQGASTTSPVAPTNIPNISSTESSSEMTILDSGQLRSCNNLAPSTYDARIPVSDTPANLNAPALHSSERRHLTIVCCEISQEQGWLENANPDQWDQMMSQVEAICIQSIQNWEGSLAQSLDSIFSIYFGYPTAHEDDADRAVEASLVLFQQLQSWKQAANLPCTIRIGIHSGQVIMGDRKGRKVALGECPNLASGIKDLSQNQVLISHDTLQLLSTPFDTELAGNYSLRGLASPMPVHHVLAQRKQDTQTTWTPRLAPLCGRDQELGLLKQRWEQTAEGTGQIVAMSGEPGIGKNRLVEEFKNQITEPYFLAECRGTAYGQFTAWYAVSNMLPTLFGWKESDRAAQRYAKMEAILSQYDLALEEAIPLLSTLLISDDPARTGSISNAATPTPTTANKLASDSQRNLSKHSIQQLDTEISPQQQKQKTQEILLSLLLQMSKKQPLLWIGKELQWWDPTSLEFLEKLLPQIESSPILLIVTLRSKLPRCFDLNVNISHLNLPRLTRKQSQSMITAILKNKELSKELMEEIITKSDGIPLFIEELTKMLLESSVITQKDGKAEISKSQAVTIPHSLQGLLMAKLDRLGIVAKEILQVASVIGREFDASMLVQLNLWEQSLLCPNLSSLVDSQLLQRKGIATSPTYSFKHLLIQEAAYQSLVKSDQQKYHQKIGEILENAGLAKTQPEVVAHHYSKGTSHAKAISLWQEAAQQCIRRSAGVEALHQLQRALELLPMLPNTKEREQQTLQIQIAMGIPLIMTKGYASSEVQKHYSDAYDLALKQPQAEFLFPILRGLWSFYFVRFDIPKSHRIAQQLVEIAKDKTTWWLAAQYALGNSLFFAGDLEASLACWNNILSKYDPQQYPPAALSLDIDVGVISLVRLAYQSNFIGDETTATKKCEEALQLARRISHSYSLVGGLCQAAWLYNFREQWDVALQYSTEARQLSEQKGFMFWQNVALMLSSHALIGQKRYAEGITQMEQGLAIHAKLGAELLTPVWISVLALAYQQQGRTALANETMSKAISKVDRYPKLLHKAEIYWRKACLSYANKLYEEAMSYLTQAREFANAQNAKAMIRLLDRTQSEWQSKTK